MGMRCRMGTFQATEHAGMEAKWTERATRWINATEDAMKAEGVLHKEATWECFNQMCFIDPSDSLSRDANAYNYEILLTDEPWGGAHFRDLGMLFQSGAPELLEYAKLSGLFTGDAEYHAAGEKYTEAVASFMRTGVPSLPGVEWPATYPSKMLISSTPKVVSANNGRREAWLEFKRGIMEDLGVDNEKLNLPLR